VSTYCILPVVFYIVISDAMIMTYYFNFNCCKVLLFLQLPLLDFRKLLAAFLFAMPVGLGGDFVFAVPLLPLTSA